MGIDACLGEVHIDVLLQRKKAFAVQVIDKTCDRVTTLFAEVSEALKARQNKRGASRICERDYLKFLRIELVWQCHLLAIKLFPEETRTQRQVEACLIEKIFPEKIKEYIARGEFFSSVNRFIDLMIEIKTSRIEAIFYGAMRDLNALLREMDTLKTREDLQSKGLGKGYKRYSREQIQIDKRYIVLFSCEKIARKLHPQNPSKERKFEKFLYRRLLKVMGFDHRMTFVELGDAARAALCLRDILSSLKEADCL